MGVEYRGQLVVGYDIDELETIASKAGIPDIEEYCSRDKAEVLGMAKFAPYYDADYDDCIYGRSVARSDDYSAARVSIETLEGVGLMMDEMLEEFGIRPDIYIMAEGT
jgi:hypothetical protein